MPAVAGSRASALSGLPLKRCYDSDSDDLLGDFYVPALSVSVRYRRLAGYFSSTSLAVAARGLSRFVLNGGTMQLVSGVTLSRDDVEVITQAREGKTSLLGSLLLGSLEDLEAEFVRDHVKALGWMIANGRLDIRVALPIPDDEIANPLEPFQGGGIFHPKVGILEDADGNVIAFSGSDNETASGWTHNIEEFKVFRSWVGAEKPYLDSDQEKFEKYWNDKAFRTKVVDIPDAVRNKLIQIAPTSFDEIGLEKWLRRAPRRHGTPQLWEHQSQAIQCWLENDKRGILEMATGTGKTFVALGCLRRVLLDESRLVTVISCPYDHLVKQWNDDVKEFALSCPTLIADSSAQGWKGRLANALSDIRTGVSSKLIVLTTHDTLSGDDFKAIITKAVTPLFLIVDEVHGVGASKRSEGLLDEYNYRLGLSATPRRYFDDEGTEAIFNYFGRTVYELTLAQAIRTINPATGKTFLTPYEYKPFFVHLNEEELLKYESETKKIARSYYQSRGGTEREALFALLCFKRQEIVKNAEAKFEALRKVLDGLGSNLNHCLIYCSDKQIDPVLRLLKERQINYHKFTMVEGTTPEDQYGGLSEREFLVQGLGNGTYQVLVAIKCLDEGVDIPTAEVGIVMASSGNPREFIQRRGRILRRPQGPSTKKVAILYDVLVSPSEPSAVDSDLRELERAIFQKEIGRYKEFAETANNSLECLNKLHDVESGMK